MIGNKGRKLWLFAQPLETKGLSFLPLPTRLVANDANSLLTYLGVDDEIDYEGARESFLESFVGVRLLQGWDLPQASDDGFLGRTVVGSHDCYTAGEILFHTRCEAGQACRGNAAPF